MLSSDFYLMHTCIQVLVWFVIPPYLGYKHETEQQNDLKKQQTNQHSCKHIRSTSSYDDSCDEQRDEY